MNLLSVLSAITSTTTSALTTTTSATHISSSTTAALVPLGPNDSWPFDGKPFFTVQLGYVTALVFTGAFICSGGGIGGGGVFVPSFLLALGLSAHWALPLSQVTIFGVGLGSCLFLLPRRHPTLPRRLIDLNLAALLEPATLLGTIPGVFLNVVFPAYIITILLVLLLGVTSYTTLSKGRQQQRVEDAARAAVNAETRPLLAESINSVVALSPNNSGGDAAASPVAKKAVMGTEAAHDGKWKWYQFGALFVCCAVLAASSYVKSQSWLVCGSLYYWLVVCSPVPVVLAFCVFFAMQPPKRGRYPWIWTVAGLTAGLVAGFLGIGGGMVKSPLMISMGTTPQVATATASFMIVFTSAATTLQFFLIGRLRWQFALWFGITGMLGSFSGQFVLARIIKHYNRQSWVSYFVGFVIFSCAVAMVVTNVIDILHDLKVYGVSSMQFKPVCDANLTMMHNATDRAFFLEQ